MQQTFRVVSSATLLVAALAVSSGAEAQTVTKVRVAVSGTGQYSANSCSVGAPKKVEAKKEDKAKNESVADGGAKDGKDEAKKEAETKPTKEEEKPKPKSILEIHIQNDVNKDVEPLKTIWISVGDAKSYVKRPEQSATIEGDFGGKTLTIVQDSDILVCSLTIPKADEPVDPVERQVRVGIGATFDFLNGLSGTDVYSDVTAFFPAVWKPRNTEKKSDRWAFGIDAGLYNGRTVPVTDSTIVEMSTADVGKSKILPRASATDSIRRIVQRARRSETNSVDRLGAYVAATLGLADGLFVVLQGEAVKRDVVTALRYVVTDSNTVTEAPQPRIPLSGAGTLLPADTTIKTRWSDHVAIYSTGILVNLRRSNLEFRVKPTAGFTVEMRGDQVRYYSQYTVQFRVTDFEHGFKIGGDVRGQLDGRKSTFLVYLAKDFGFKRLGSFILGSGED